MKNMYLMRLNKSNFQESIRQAAFSNINTQVILRFSLSLSPPNLEPLIEGQIRHKIKEYKNE